MMLKAHGGHEGDEDLYIKRHSEYINTRRPVAESKAFSVQPRACKGATRGKGKATVIHSVSTDIF